MISTELSFINIERNSRMFFGIQEAPVRYEDPNNNSFFKHYPNKKVLINKDSNEAISIVASNFFSVTNKEAFDLGVKIFELMFGVTPQVHQESMNSRETDYSVDLISENCKIVFDNSGYNFVGNRDVVDVQNSSRGNRNRESDRNQLNFISSGFYDEYYPFVRVSNYLRENSSFYIELGYYRYRCSNGLMLGRRTKMTFRHSYRVRSFDIIKQSAIDQFLRYKGDFMKMAENLWKLLSIHIPKGQIRLVTFNIFESVLIKKSKAERMRLQLILNDLADKYILEIGENLNAALNIATEFSKLLNSGKVSQVSIQKFATDWVTRVTKKSFNINSYLKDINNAEEKVMNAKDVVEEDDDEEEGNEQN